jgi:hypothetical protein
MRRAAETSRMACRLLRHEVKALAVLSDGTHVAGNRDWVFWSRPGDHVMTPSTIDQGGDAVWPPMIMTVGPGDRVIWGEYGGSKHNPRPVRVYVSEDGGRSFEVCHVFEGGSIRHVHNVIHDTHIGGYWVLAGDHDHEPGIGRLSGDLKDFEWVTKGEQQYRAVCVFDLGDELLYGTDTEMEPNALIRLDKATGRTERVLELPGSVIYACRFGGIYALSTTVEPSAVNKTPDAQLWLSRDGESWHCVHRARKDRWHAVLFQFGSIVLPRGASGRQTIMFSGQAVRGLDGQTITAEWTDALV